MGARDRYGQPIELGDELVVLELDGQEVEGEAIDFRDVGNGPEVAVEFPFGRPLWIPADQIAVVPF